ncbi:Conjugal transfer protein TraB [Pectobacterium atrosepticum ICMP 1526]|uniref:lytic transglycosylase domain-containing protein n=1 Tax=Pectobacterium atrosepticum TaxID=29471 RepID=UPI0005035E21|nr:lytic transglycosylase domain-containing protein [Pectobacterium atrosepticum]KFX10699.1 conjugal transfer protein TraB [Pectobacterium atrosepticum]KMK87272.1 Conjugal transfer protein TraB [Pectobacterium atrosepticum ICMP 1526]
MVLSSAALAGLLLQCSGNVEPITMKTIISVESDSNPYQIANVTDGTSHSFENKEDAVLFANDLESKGKKYSAGLGQIYSGNYKKYNITNDTVFDFCTNISTASKIFEDCYYRAITSGNYADEQYALRAAASCYYSNNFLRGFKKEKNGVSYVELANKAVNKIYSVPAMTPVDEAGAGGGDSSVEQKKLRREAVTQNQVVNDSGDSRSWDVFKDFVKK